MKAGWTTIALVLASTGCAITGPEGDDEDDVWHEPETAETRMAEATFNRHDVLDDASLTDADAMTVAEVQDFLENNPYGWQSVLATVVSNGVPASQAFVDAAQAHGINPLVLLTRVQLEQSLIGKTSASKATLDKAFGCGCPDNQPCAAKYKGFDKQLDCAASKFRDYLDDMADSGTTVAGWGVGITKKSLDQYFVTPVNQATAAIYTYTPWVSSAMNHTKIWAKYTAYVGYTGPSVIDEPENTDPPEPEDPTEPTEPTDPTEPTALDVIIDDDPSANGPTAAFDASSSWTESSSTPGYQVNGYSYRSTGASSDLANFRVYLDEPAEVIVEAWWTQGANRASSAPFLVYDAQGNHLDTVHANQQQNGSQWVTLGSYAFTQGWNTVALSRWTSSGLVVVADAVRVRAAP